MKNSDRKLHREVVKHDKKEAAIDRQYKRVEAAERVLEKQTKALWKLVNPTDDEVAEASSQISQMDADPTDLDKIRMVLQLRDEEFEGG